MPVSAFTAAPPDDDCRPWLVKVSVVTSYVERDDVEVPCSGVHCSGVRALHKVGRLCRRGEEILGHLIQVH